MQKTHSILLYPFLSSLIVAGAFLLPQHMAPPLVFIGFIPFLFFLYQPLEYKKIFFISFFPGTLFFGLTLHWLFATLPLDWAGIESFWTGFSIFFLVWLVIIIGFAFWWGIFGVAGAFIFRRITHPLIASLVISGAWVLTEYFRAFVFGLIWYAPGQSAIGPDWTFANIAYLLSSSMFASLARFGGMYGLDFFIIFVNTLLFFILWKTGAKQIFRRFLAIAGFSLGVLFLGYMAYRLDGALFSLEDLSEGKSKVTVAAVNINFPKAFYYQPLEQKRKAKKIAELVKTIKKPVDIIVLPEIAEFISSYNIYSDADLIEVLHRNQPLIVDHDYGGGEARTTPQTVYWQAQKGIFARQDKELLMPGGEYLPWLLRKGLLLFGNESLIIAYERRRTVYPSQEKIVVEYERGKASSLLCSEVMSSRIAREITRKGSQIIFLQSSDAIFQGNNQYLKQMIAMAQMRAIETGRFIVRSSNGGVAAFIDPSGRITQLLPKGEGVLSGEVYLLDRETPYTFFGDVPIILFSFFLLLGVVRRRGVYK